MVSRKRLWGCTAILAVSVSATAPAQQQVLDRIAAIVDNEIILESDLQAQVQFLANNNRIDPKTPGLRDQVLQNMINENLMVAKAIEDSVTVTDDEVQQQLDASIQQRVLQVGSEARLEELYGMPISRIKREYRDEMRKSLLAQRLQQQKFGTLTVGRYEVEDFFNTYKDSLPPVPEELQLSNIFVFPKASDAMRNAARSRAQALIDSLNAGADFAALAKRYSQDPGSAQQGGDLGLVRRGQFVKEFESAVFAMTEGQVSGIIETDFGYHIIQLMERRGDAVHARHILIRVEKSGSSDSLALALLDSVRSLIPGTMTFAEAAKKFSEDKETNLLGGNRGTIDIDQLDKTWYPALANLKDGEISKPFRISTSNSYGFQLVQVRKRTPAHKMTIETDYLRIENLTVNFKRQKEYQRFLDEIRKTIYWKINQ